ncbi:MAG: archease [Halobacteriaceae archaeon]
MSGTFELREHTADVAVAASGATAGDVFAAVADGLAAAACESVPESGDRFRLVERAESREALLFDYLDALIRERDIRGVLPVDNRAAVSAPDDGPGGETDGDWTVEASARGVSLGDVAARDVKAVTYSEMRIEQTADGWEAYVVFDV